MENFCCQVKRKTFSIEKILVAVSKRKEFHVEAKLDSNYE